MRAFWSEESDTIVSRKDERNQIAIKKEARVSRGYEPLSLLPCHMDSFGCCSVGSRDDTDPFAALLELHDALNE